MLARRFDFILGPVKSHKWVFGEGVKYPDRTLERSLGSWVGSGIHSEHQDTPDSHLLICMHAEGLL